MSRSSRNRAFLAYLLSVPGALYVLLARRDDAFAVFHARQSLAIAITARVTPLVWVVVAWAGAWIPVAGPLVGLTLFALVIATYLGLAALWIAGMVFALNGMVRSLPVVGSWATPRRKAALPPPAESETVDTPEFVERRVSDV
jgi:uncharacterized membrane protein